MAAIIETHSGVGFKPLAPIVSSIKIEDIAHALSHQCRFSGHTRVHYSVAEHCVRVAQLLERWKCVNYVQRWGLLHDASEAYLVDLPSPLKTDERFAFYREAERRLTVAICEQFGLCADEPVAVAAADGVLLATEARDLMYFRRLHWEKLEHAPLAEKIVPWDCARAKHEFLRCFERLFARDTIPNPPPRAA